MNVGLSRGWHSQHWRLPTSSPPVFYHCHPHTYLCDMATEFLSTFSQFGGKPVPSYLLDSIEVRSDLDRVHLSITDASAPNGEIFANTYYPIGGYLQIEMLAAIIESHMRRHHYSVCDITISLGSRTDTEASLTLSILYSDYVLPRPAEIHGFLTTCASRRIHRGSMIALTVLMPQAGDTVKFIGVGHSKQGKHSTVYANITSALHYDNGRSMILSVNSIITWALKLPDAVEANIVDIDYFSLEYDGSVRTFYIMNDSDWMLFGFRNIFNAREFIDVVGYVKNKTLVSRSMAVASGHAMHYNQSTERTYEVTTAALPIAEARAFDHLLNSRTTELYTADIASKILITDHTCEIDNDDESIASVKFTFRFTDQRPHLMPDEIQPILPSGGIFAEQFTFPFA